MLACEPQGHPPIRAGEPSAARAQSQRATELEPRNAKYRNNYGWVLFRLGKVEAAERELEETLRLNTRCNAASESPTRSSAACDRNHSA